MGAYRANNSCSAAISLEKHPAATTTCRAEISSPPASTPVHRSPSRIRPGDSAIGANLDAPMLRRRDHRAHQRPRLDRALFGKPRSCARGRSDPALPLPRRIQRDRLRSQPQSATFRHPAIAIRLAVVAPKISPASLRARNRSIARMLPRSMLQIPDRVSDFHGRGAPAARRAVNPARAIAFPPPPRTLRGPARWRSSTTTRSFSPASSNAIAAPIRPPPMMATSNVFTRLS